MAAGEVNDGEAAMAQGDVGIGEQASVVGAAMEEGIAHADEGRFIQATG
jgi:hypothetical protein